MKPPKYRIVITLNLCFSLIPAISLGQFFIYPNSPEQHLIQYSEDNIPELHSLSYSRPIPAYTFLKDAPVGWKSYLSPDALNIRPAASISVSRTQRHPTLRTITDGFGMLSKHLYFGTQVQTSNAFDRQWQLGTGYSRIGATGRITRAWLVYTSKHLDFTFGRDALQWGPARFSHINLTGNVPPYDMMHMRLKKGLFDLSWFTAQFPTRRFHGMHINRYFTGHRLEYISDNSRLNIGLGDLTLYTGENRTINWAISNPLMPVVPLMFEGLEWRGEQGGDNENAQLLFDATYYYLSKQRIYLELAIDDFQIDSKDRERLDDAVGATIGQSGVVPISERFNLQIQTEISILNTWVYNHHGVLTSWLYKNRPLGNQESGDVIEYHQRLDFWNNFQWSLGIQFDYAAKGEIQPDDPWNPEGTKHAKFPLGVVEYHRIVTLDFYRYIKLKYIRPYVTYESIHNINHDVHKDQTDWNIGLDVYLWI